MSLLNRILGLMDPGEAADRFTPDLVGVPETAMASAAEQARVGISPQVQEDVIAGTLAHTTPPAGMDMSGAPVGARLAMAGQVDQARGRQIGDTLRTLWMESDAVRREGQQRLEGYQIARQQTQDQMATMHTQMEAQVTFGNQLARRQTIAGVLGAGTMLGVEFFGPQPEMPQYHQPVTASTAPQNHGGWPGRLTQMFGGQAQVPGVRGGGGLGYQDDEYGRPIS